MTLEEEILEFLSGDFSVCQDSETFYVPIDKMIDFITIYEKKGKRRQPLPLTADNTP